ncbi:aldo/keto reductase [Staphylococcus delphini]|uniref:aldo/keto reductase n=1 Tax=Staphylococcus delphini TaxID=53344 RepID=UPI0023B33093|nr:aldo/keto reductase [Staphylococcus delphini]MDE9752240.1 aldo/keto reductase [Staphylococcus delphini]MDE9790283.1 aldo/keto reductase [Staphylococcus delphini]MDE9791878.1 aldo/keto reductase [Staphylococcus delphini]MDE9795131.1 aldo/keto reductase [Staphylococcus delphini]MDE9796353.1 aldo/keto reductase [Staphylococcus delphini]
MKHVTFYNGNQMPQVGLGVFRVENNDTAKEAVKHAIKSGYRSIDTAMIYQNEEKVGEGIREALAETDLMREDLFITSKLWLSDYGRENVAAAYQASLDRLGLDYLDLYLVHWPGLDEDVMIDTWKGMEDLYHDQKVKNIGVSNFNVEHLDKLLATSRIKPVINQVEFHPYLTQKRLRVYLEAQNIHMESWSPLMNAQILKDDTVKQVAAEVGKSPAQVIIRWNVQHGVVTIPKSITPSRIEENLNVFDFELSLGQMEALDGLNEDRRIGPDPLHFDGK